MPLREEDLLTLAEKRARQEPEAELSQAEPSQADRPMLSVYPMPWYTSGRPSMSPGGWADATEGLVMQPSAPFAGEEQSEERESEEARTEHASECVIA
jgi:hypothetical protein